MRQQSREVLEGLTIEHSLCLVVRARYDDAQSTQRSRLKGERHTCLYIKLMGINVHDLVCRESVRGPGNLVSLPVTMLPTAHNAAALTSNVYS